MPGLGEAGKNDGQAESDLDPEDQVIDAGDGSNVGAAGEEKIFGDDSAGRVQNSQLGGGQHQAGDNQKEGGNESKCFLADDCGFGKNKINTRGVAGVAESGGISQKGEHEHGKKSEDPENQKMLEVSEAPPAAETGEVGGSGGKGNT
ncbi:MAG: hypothetical protein UY33_C0032G0023 [Candidatus Amesbacteria bacterium GW2011_GWA1_48_9]|uniref:Uncharacterized protein n=1 Tax=Candidatus Amesbacteria bacterium GW2011_GWA1_48_9 TaxID=1618355 RepID=A0A0G1UYU4_9BACT|nr:MAG: hypothetical protein UY33_C0032G0023 [Candidatus Amesbacteria bacterium GW2011_GWA1_48_9]